MNVRRFGTDDELVHVVNVLGVAHGTRSETATTLMAPARPRAVSLVPSMDRRRCRLQGRFPLQASLRCRAWGFILFSFSDDNDTGHADRVENVPERVYRRSVNSVLVSPPHPSSRCHGGRFCGPDHSSARFLSAANIVSPPNRLYVALLPAETCEYLVNPAEIVIG